MVVQNFPIYKDFLLIFFPTDTTASNFGGLCKHNEIGYNDFEKVKSRNRKSEELNSNF